MKVVKLNRRFRQYKEYGHTVALRFPNGLTPDAQAIHRVCGQKLNGSGWMREHDWYSYYGKNSGRYDVRPYWITFRRESDLTMILLSAKIN